ncbi:MAG: TIGR04282 family arsenosugar biosynthesis glycosyltransferase [Pseudomonadales bacterium]|jgi:hypothetical protein|nr:TIGR04282 family arsenosugar biosynthesis glycosyltransferase [Pseudomonadales bacterium]MDP7360443.1 TIGR04282 family arsenosugar biosynthesis glycosyltransferase [Pseudomonadales bacterium]MDP7594172.1 TIGR04282 family arsenosugar biosynthesis glycosyltransferase [Pseudomonadales bacterium]HJN52877.1 TIGR04282 family arsenosugar biosynthesis glycosyltransferase [Pseudomonadales bacterium]|tara:strand:+ start:1887 stop:2525 length:639 start_codon:yes stop_codon:yes gene_type:complete
MQFPDARILLFCRTPQPGKVKTRLIPALGSEAASQLYTRLLRHAVQTVLDAHLCPLEIWVTPDAKHPFFSEWAELDSVELFVQSGADLGMRMYNATMDARMRAQSVVLIGGDCPLMSAGYLESALTKLQRGYDAVVGPAEDGGYVLLGLRQCHLTLFEQINWGAETVCEETCRRLDDLHWRWSLLEELWDIDRPEDLDRLAGVPQLSGLVSN